AANHERFAALPDVQQTVEKVELALASVEARGSAGGKRCVDVEVPAHVLASHLSLLDGCDHQLLRGTSRCRCCQPENFDSGKPEGSPFGLTRSRRLRSRR